MKNIHVIPTQELTRLHFDEALFLSPNPQISCEINSIVEGRNIYITSDEEIGTDEYYFHLKNNEYYNSGRIEEFDKDMKFWRKIILTTDQDLIADGIEQISEDVLLKIVQHINSGKNIESFDRL